VLRRCCGGDYPELIEGDVFRTIVKVPDFATYYPDQENLKNLRSVSGHESRPESGTAVKIIQALRQKDLSTSQIAEALGHKTISGEVKKQLKELLSLGFIEITLPEKPQSRLQKYRLTEKDLESIAGGK